MKNGVFKDMAKSVSAFVAKALFVFCRFVVRCASFSYRIVYTGGKAKEPAVYVVRHQNLRGPVLGMAWLDRPMRPWVLSVFCEQATCFRQYYEYTFTQRFRISKPIAGMIAYPLSFGVAGLMRGMGAIPVFRGSKNILQTFQDSILALLEGENLLIAPDIDYALISEKVGIGEMYTGFLHLGKLYLRESGNRLAFVPLHISKAKKNIYVGTPIYFNPGGDFRQGRQNVYVRLRQEFYNLEKTFSD